MQKISKDTPLAEITLRKYEMPGNLSEREIVRKICLSLGLLQPGDSRDIIVDILHVLLDAAKKKKGLYSPQIEEQVIERREQNNLSLQGIASSNIRRQLRRLKEIHLIERVLHQYRITEFLSLEQLYKEQIEQYFLRSIQERILRYLKAFDEKSDAERK